MRVVDDDLLAEQMARGAQSEEFYEERLIEFGVEHHGVLVGLIGEEHGERHEGHGANPHAVDHVPLAVARHLHARGVDDVINDKDCDRDDRRQAQTAFAYDCAERCSHKEEDEAGERKCHFLMPFYPVAANVFLAVCQHLAFPFEVGAEGHHIVLRHTHHLLPFRVGQLRRQ